MTTTITQEPADTAAEAGSADRHVLDLRDDLATVRGIAASMALSAPFWAGVAAFVWWLRNHPG